MANATLPNPRRPMSPNLPSRLFIFHSSFVTLVSPFPPLSLAQLRGVGGRFLTPNT
jgi:hypothetical protein